MTRDEILEGARVKIGELDALAHAFKRLQPFLPSGEDAETLTREELAQRRGRLLQWSNDVVVVADTLAQLHPRFNRLRFYRLAGVTPFATDDTARTASRPSREPQAGS